MSILLIALIVDQNSHKPIASIMFHREIRFTASFIADQWPTLGFYTFTRDPYETCREHPDEKVEEQVQVARIYGETGNT